MHIKRNYKMILCLTVLFALILTSCGVKRSESGGTEAGASSDSADISQGFGAEEEISDGSDVMILFTSDIHYGIDQGFGYAGLQQVRDTLEARGYQTILVDDGDAIQREAIGTISKGEAIIDIMNLLKYDIAIPGNHEFDYGMDRFLELTWKADFPYISCNFTREGSLVFKPYKMIEAAGMKIAFVGITTPVSLRTSTPAYFQDEKGQFIYGFMEDKRGGKLYEAVQKAVDDARAEGADYVYAVSHPHGPQSRD